MAGGGPVTRPPTLITLVADGPIAVSSPRPTALLLALVAVAALAVGAGGYDPDLGGGTTEGRPTLTPSGGDAGAAGSSGPGPGGGSGPPPLWPDVDPGADREQSPDLRLLVGAALVVAGGAVAVYALTTDERAPDRGSEGDGTATPAVDYGDPGANGVYRSWARLRDHVGVDGTATPAELARRARRAGAPGDAVSEVTRLFRRVRYGDEDASERAERRASAAADRATDDGGDT